MRPSKSVVKEKSSSSHAAAASGKENVSGDVSLKRALCPALALPNNPDIRVRRNGRSNKTTFLRGTVAWQKSVQGCLNRFVIYGLACLSACCVAETLFYKMINNLFKALSFKLSFRAHYNIT